MPLDDLAKTLRSARKKPIFDATDIARVEIGRPKIEQLLPHRGRMLLLDKIVGVHADGRLEAIRTIASDDPVFDGHFPGDPVYPGALQIEAIGQAGLCMWHFTNNKTHEVGPEVAPTPVRLLRVIEAAFLHPVRPNDVVTLRCRLLEDNGYTFITLGQMVCGDRVVSVGAFEAMILDPEESF